MGAVSISPDVADVLTRSTVEGNLLRLPAGQLDRALYAATDKVLKALGGKWDLRAGGHAFPFDPADKLADAMGTGRVVSRQQALQHFDTPDDLADRLVSRLGVGHDDCCLEPSAGRGRIVAALAKRRPFDLTAVEIDHDNANALKAQGLCGNLFVKDFLSCKPHELADMPLTVVAMNPPFSRNQDIKHVRHAFDCLSPGGRLGAIVSEHGFIGQETECVEWRDWLFEIGATVYAIPAGAFKESGTGVQTRMIVVRKSPHPTALAKREG